MEPDAYHAMAANEDVHWWYRARRRVLAEVLRRHAPPAPRRVLEIGCGTGGNLGMLGGFGPVTGVESSDVALDYCRRAGYPRLFQGHLPDHLPPDLGESDWVCLLDVLEHMQDDTAALRACHRLIGPGGALIVTVPAYPWLWGPHDQLHHHERRYTRASLIAVAAKAGFEPALATYFNFWLFPLAVAARVKDRWLGSRSSAGLGPPPRWLNEIMFRIFSSERYLIGRVPLPFGLSICAILRKIVDTDARP